jgi:DNA polymerase-3 subunit delta
MRAMLAEKAGKTSSKSLLSGLASCFKKLRNYNTLIETGSAGNFELKKIGVSAPKAREDYSAASKRYKGNIADKCIALTAEYDLLIKKSDAALETIVRDTYWMKIIRYSVI